MLRLKPSELTLTQDDVDNTFRRLSLRQRSRALSLSTSPSSAHPGRPLLRRGPQKSTLDSFGSALQIQPQEAIYAARRVEDVEDSIDVDQLDNPVHSTLTSQQQGSRRVSAMPRVHSTRLPLRFGRGRQRPNALLIAHADTTVEAGSTSHESYVTAQEPDQTARERQAILRGGEDLNGNDEEPAEVMLNSLSTTETSSPVSATEEDIVQQNSELNASTSARNGVGNISSVGRFSHINGFGPQRRDSTQEAYGFADLTEHHNEASHFAEQQARARITARAFAYTQIAQDASQEHTRLAYHVGQRAAPTSNSTYGNVLVEHSLDERHDDRSRSAGESDSARPLTNGDVVPRSYHAIGWYGANSHRHNGRSPRSAAASAVSASYPPTCRSTTWLSNANASFNGLVPNDFTRHRALPSFHTSEPNALASTNPFYPRNPRRTYVSPYPPRPSGQPHTNPLPTRLSGSTSTGAVFRGPNGVPNRRQQGPNGHYSPFNRPSNASPGRAHDLRISVRDSFNEVATTARTWPRVPLAQQNQENDTNVEGRTYVSHHVDGMLVIRQLDRTSELSNSVGRETTENVERDEARARAEEWPEVMNGRGEAMHETPPPRGRGMGGE